MVIAIVVFSIVVMIAIQMLLEKKHRAAEQTVSAQPIFNRKNLLAPAGYYFSNGHTYAAESTEGIKIGLDSFICNALSNMKLNKISLEGTAVKKGDVIFEGDLEGKKVSFRSPISGNIKKINNDIYGMNLKTNFEDNWGLIIEPEDSDNQFKLLKSGEDAVNWMKSEFKRLKDFLSIHAFAAEPVGVTMYDGGNVVKGVVSKLNTNVIQDFEEQFLMVD